MEGECLTVGGRVADYGEDGGGMVCVPDQRGRTCRQDQRGAILEGQRRG